MNLLAKRDPVIARLETARTALRTATSLDQVKSILDLAAASEVYARRQQLGEELIGYAHAIKIEALGRLGVLLAAMPKNRGAEGVGPPIVLTAGKDNTQGVPTYAELGLDYRTAMVAQQLAALPDAVRQAIAAREITLTEARRQTQHAARPTLRLPEGRFRVLYADPPWRYRDTRSGLGGDTQRVDRAETAAAQDYPTLSCDALCAMEIAALAHADAVLFCWATFPLLPDALRVVAAWGFTYKTAFVWHKPRGSFGHYHKADAELLLLATRGSCTPDDSHRPSQIITAATAGHSRKPEAARELIDRLYVHGPRLELFARRPAPGAWQVWGNEPR